MLVGLVLMAASLCICWQVSVSGARRKFDWPSDYRYSGNILLDSKELQVRNFIILTQISVMPSQQPPLLNISCLNLQGAESMVQGSPDETVPVEDALAFAKIVPNQKLRIIEGADHEFTSHQGELASVVQDFVRSTPPSCIRADKITRSRLWLSVCRLKKQLSGKGIRTKFSQIIDSQVQYQIPLKKPCVVKSSTLINKNFI